ncbi:MAG: 16S rRNA (uracil(1498)-N(3))-methyltransferase [Proteobacteria bacterium]|nr:16S rRNA (uracil(1498)-N(3))-methyltransferase [Pseudomonadota bacterium]
MIRLHVESPLRAGVRVEPTSDQARYLTGVMRQKLGDSVLLFNGRDGEWRASLVEIGKRGCVLTAEVQTRAQTSVPDLELVAALVKRGPLETIVEKAVELGCARVRLITTRRTNADHVRLERLRAIMVEAAEQTGRLDVPEIIAPEKLERLLDGWDASRRLMFCDEGEGFDALQDGASAPASAPVLPALDALRDAPRGPWAVLIGPEGGFDPSERERLRGLAFCTPVSLGPRILRADTAAISALTLWQAALGDWRA